MLQYGFVYIFVLHWNPDSLHMCSGGWRFESDIYHVRIPLPSSCLTLFFFKCKLEYQSDFATNVAHLLVLFPLEKKHWTCLRTVLNLVPAAISTPVSICHTACRHRHTLGQGNLPKQFQIFFGLSECL